LGYFNSITSNSESNSKVLVHLIGRIFAASVKFDTEDEVSLLEVRAGYGLTNYWHTDDNFKSFIYRNILTLVGPSTIFYNDSTAIDRGVQGLE
jgi:hypothetical protein